MNFASMKKNNGKYWLLAGLVVLAALAGLFWLNSLQVTISPYQTAAAERGTLTANVGATGTVRSAQSATLLWSTSGRVDTVKVGLGEKVSKDQVLAGLAPDSVSRGIILAQADLVNARQNLDNLQKSNSNVAQAMKTLSDANQAVKDAQDAYDSLTRKRVSDELIQDTSDQIDRTQDQLKRIEYFYKRFFSHLADGNATKAQMIITLTNIRENLASLKAKYNWYTSHASENEIARSLAALNLAKARQQDAQREMDRLKDGKNQDDLNAARARVAAAQATFDLSKITAPFNGTITQTWPQAGDRVTAGQSAFRVDDLSKLMVDLLISEVDINNVAVDQPVTISFDAVPEKTYNGLVSKVNLAARAGQGGVNFNVTVRLTDADELVKPGMSAAVTITVKQVSDSLIVPNRAIRMVDGGQHVVYVLKDGLPAQVLVRLGATADANSQVVGGDLKEGDLIVLNPPAPTSSAASLPGATPQK
jgi:HlyD family secretion protein